MSHHQGQYMGSNFPPQTYSQNNGYSYPSDNKDQGAPMGSNTTSNPANYFGNDFFDSYGSVNQQYDNYQQYQQEQQYSYQPTVNGYDPYQQYSQEQYYDQNSQYQNYHFEPVNPAPVLSTTSADQELSSFQPSNHNDDPFSNNVPFDLSNSDGIALETLSKVSTGATENSYNNGTTVMEPPMEYNALKNANPKAHAPVTEINDLDDLILGRAENSVTSQYPKEATVTSVGIVPPMTSRVSASAATPTPPMAQKTEVNSFCTKCGQRNEFNSNFCGNCGNSLIKKAPTPAPPIQAALQSKSGTPGPDAYQNLSQASPPKNSAENIYRSTPTKKRINSAPVPFSDESFSELHKSSTQTVLSAQVESQYRDPLGRDQGHPIITFGFGRLVVTGVKKAHRFVIQNGQRVETQKTYPDMVKIHSSNYIVGPSCLNDLKLGSEPLVGPKSKLKKKDVLKIVDDILLNTKKLAAGDILLWKVLRALIDQDGLIGKNPKEISDLLLDEKIASGDVIDTFERLLYAGDRKAACDYAVSQSMWAHALIIASHINRECYSDVITRFVQSGLALKVHAAGSSIATRVLFGQFGGIAKENVLSSIMSLENTEQWKEVLCMLLSNRTANDHLIIAALGDYLIESGNINAAHTCFVLSGMTMGNMGGIDSPATKLVLLGANHQKEKRVSKNTCALKKSLLFEYSQTLLHSAGLGNIIPHLQPYKLLYAAELADYGLFDEAMKYCESIQWIVKGYPKGSPYFHRRFLETLRELTIRLEQPTSAQATSEKDSSWFAGTTGLFSVLDRGINKIMNNAVGIPAEEKPASPVSKFVEPLPTKPTSPALAVQEFIPLQENSVPTFYSSSKSRPGTAGAEAPIEHTVYHQEHIYSETNGYYTQESYQYDQYNAEQNGQQNVIHQSYDYYHEQSYPTMDSGYGYYQEDSLQNPQPIVNLGTEQLLHHFDAQSATQQVSHGQESQPIIPATIKSESYVEAAQPPMIQSMNQPAVVPLEARPITTSVPPKVSQPSPVSIRPELRSQMQPSPPVLQSELQTNRSEPPSGQQVGTRSVRSSPTISPNQLGPSQSGTSIGLVPKISEAQGTYGQEQKQGKISGQPPQATPTPYSVPARNNPIAQPDVSLKPNPGIGQTHSQQPHLPPAGQTYNHLPTNRSNIDLPTQAPPTNSNFEYSANKEHVTQTKLEKTNEVNQPPSLDKPQNVQSNQSTEKNETNDPITENSETKTEENKEDSSKGWGLGSWIFGDKKKNDQKPAPTKAKLGEEKKFYYDEKSKKWVFEGQEATETNKPLAPPPMVNPISSSAPATPKIPGGDELGGTIGRKTTKKGTRAKYVDVLNPDSMDKEDTGPSGFIPPAAITNDANISTFQPVQPQNIESYDGQRSQSTPLERFSTSPRTSVTSGQAVQQNYRPSDMQSNPMQQNYRPNQPQSNPMHQNYRPAPQSNPMQQNYRPSEMQPNSMQQNYRPSEPQPSVKPSVRPLPSDTVNRVPPNRGMIPNMRPNMAPVRPIMRKPTMGQRAQGPPPDL